jgi:hypothetical protein
VQTPPAFPAPQAKPTVAISRAWGLASAALIGVVAVFDINNSPGIALIEFVIAVAAALIAIASFAGRTKTKA